MRQSSYYLLLTATPVHPTLLVLPEASLFTCYVKITPSDDILLGDRNTGCSDPVHMGIVFGHSVASLSVTSGMI